MDCCQFQGIESRFNRQRVEKKLKSYRDKGPDDTTKMLLDALRSEGIQGMTLLDVGGGVGVIQHELLKVGISSVCSVEASVAATELSKEEAVRQGHADRITYYHGDFAQLAPTLPPADVVTLDRVICCYHDMPSLVEFSAQRARRYYGVVYPRDSMRAKLITAIYNISYRLRRESFRLFIYPTKVVDALICQYGLRPCFQKRTSVWEIVLYARTGQARS